METKEEILKKHMIASAHLASDKEALAAMQEYADQQTESLRGELKDGTDCVEHMKEVCDNYEKGIQSLQAENERIRDNFYELEVAYKEKIQSLSARVSELEVKIEHAFKAGRISTNTSFEERSKTFLTSPQGDNK